MGNTCKSMADHVNVWQKLLQYCKVISLQLIKINGKQKQKQRKKTSPAFCFSSSEFRLRSGLVQLFL